MNTTRNEAENILILLGVDQDMVLFDTVTALDYLESRLESAKREGFYHGQMAGTQQAYRQADDMVSMILGR